MRTALLKELDALAATVVRMRHIAETLPEVGPCPIPYLHDGGALHFHGAHQLAPVLLAFGVKGLRVIDKEGLRKDFTWKLANGVQIVVENAMSGEWHHLTVTR